jgi:hypothetical protein
MPQISYRRVDRRKRESTYLLKSARNVKSQSGEDGVVDKLLELIGHDPASAWCVEFGAWDGVHLSNTWNLINKHGYSGVLIEGSAERYQDLLKTYGDVQRVHCLHRLVSFEPGPDSLDSIFADTPMPKVFDVLSIDIDGNDWYVWASMQHYEPRIVVIEYNGTIPNDVAFVQDKDFSLNQGCSLLALIDLGKKKGYELAAVTIHNAIFVRAVDFPKLGIADNSIDAMHFPLYEGKIFQGYDGTLFNVGLEKLRWTLGPCKVTPTGFQLLPEARRRFGDSIIDRRAREALASAPTSEQ